MHMQTMVYAMVTQTGAGMGRLDQSTDQRLTAETSEWSCTKSEWSCTTAGSAERQQVLHDWLYLGASYPPSTAAQGER